jgi:hypothetical protein
MAAYNVELRKNDGSVFADVYYPKTTWAMVDGKPSTYTPTSHDHDAGEIISGTLAINRGGTGFNGYTIGNMLYADSASTLAKLTTSSFGRGLLNASTGVVISGLNAQQLAGYVHSDFRKTADLVPIADLAALTAWKAVYIDGYGKLAASPTTAADLENCSGTSGNLQDQIDDKASVASIKNFAGGISSNGSTAVALPLTITPAAGQIIGIEVQCGLGSTAYGKQILWMRLGTTGTSYFAGLLAAPYGSFDASSGIIYSFRIYWNNSANLYIDEAFKISFAEAPTITATVATDINVYNVYLLG